MHINIALGFDKKYCEHASCTIKSIIENSKKPIKFHIMVDKSVSNIQKFLLKLLIHKTEHKMLFYNMQNLFEELFTGTWSRAMYYPIALSKICKEEKILFLDSDIIVTDDLSELYNTSLEDFFCAAIRDIGINSVIKKEIKFSMSYSKELINIKDYFTKIRCWGEDDLDKYFNSGVLLLNLNKIRENNADENLINILKEEKLVFPDQDCFNICFHEKIKILSMKYNFMIISKSVYDNLTIKDKMEYDKQLQTQNPPTIIHFIEKPWKTDNVIYENFYYRYRKLTPWKYKKTEIQKKKIIRLKISFKRSYLYIKNTRVFDSKV